MLGQGSLAWRSQGLVQLCLNQCFGNMLCGDYITLICTHWFLTLDWFKVGESPYNLKWQWQMDFHMGITKVEFPVPHSQHLLAVFSEPRN